MIRAKENMRGKIRAKKNTLIMGDSRLPAID
jgi:hypothetical protein